MCWWVTMGMKVAVRAFGTTRWAVRGRSINDQGGEGKRWGGSVKKSPTTYPGPLSPCCPFNSNSASRSDLHQNFAQTKKSLIPCPVHDQFTTENEKRHRVGFECRSRSQWALVSKNNNWRADRLLVYIILHWTPRRKIKETLVLVKKDCHQATVNYDKFIKLLKVNRVYYLVSRPKIPSRSVYFFPISR